MIKIQISVVNYLTEYGPRGSKHVVDVLNIYIRLFIARDKRVPVTTTWRFGRSRMEERPPIWRVAANVMNKQSRAADKGSSSRMGLGEVLTTPHRKNIYYYETFIHSIRIFIVVHLLQ